MWKEKESISMPRVSNKNCIWKVNELNAIFRTMFLNLVLSIYFALQLNDLQAVQKEMVVLNIWGEIIID